MASRMLRLIFLLSATTATTANKTTATTTNVPPGCFQADKTMFGAESAATTFPQLAGVRTETHPHVDFFDFAASNVTSFRSVRNFLRTLQRIRLYTWLGAQCSFVKTLSANNIKIFGTNCDKNAVHAHLHDNEPAERNDMADILPRDSPTIIVIIATTTTTTSSNPESAAAHTKFYAGPPGRRSASGYMATGSFETPVLAGVLYAVYRFRTKICERIQPADNTEDDVFVTPAGDVSMARRRQLGIAPVDTFAV